MFDLNKCKEMSFNDFVMYYFETMAKLHPDAEPGIDYTTKDAEQVYKGFKLNYT